MFVPAYAGNWPVVSSEYPLRYGPSPRVRGDFTVAGSVVDSHELASSRPWRNPHDIGLSAATNGLMEQVGGAVVVELKPVEFVEIPAELCGHC